MRTSLVVLVLAAGCSSPAAMGTLDLEPAPADQLVALVDASLPPDQAGKSGPILFVHGINGSAANFDQMIGRFTAAGWPAALLFAHTFTDPQWGCNVDNAAQVAGWVDEIRTQTGAGTITVIAHSMGTLSSRYFIERLGGAAKVSTYITLGGMHHGLASSCSPDFPFKPCVWTELCATGPFIADLDSDDVTKSPVHWTSIYGTGDTTVPNDSSMLAGADNVAIPGATHVGLIMEQPGYDAVRMHL